eukprot:scaffold191140_cov18-Prasinocladus_malaysianus.AAC.1
MVLSKSSANHESDRPSHRVCVHGATKNRLVLEVGMMELHGLLSLMMLLGNLPCTVRRCCLCSNIVAIKTYEFGHANCLTFQRAYDMAQQFIFSA